MPFSGAGPLALFLAKATLLLVAALLATFSLRRSTAGARHLVWLAALVGVVALPVLSRISVLQLGVLPSGFGTRAAAPVPPVALPPVPLTPVPPVPAVPAVPVAPAAPAAPATRIVVAPAVAQGAAVAIEIPRVADVPPTPGDASFPVFESTPPGWMYSALTTVAIVWGAVALALI